MKYGVLAYFLVISVSYATTFVPISTKKQLQTSSGVIKGVVVAKEVIEDETFGLATKVDIRPDKYLGVKIDGPVHSVYFPGGQLGNKVIKIEGSPEFKIGEKVVVLLSETNWINNLGLGKYAVKSVGNREVVVNQIFPDHPQIGHMSLERFFKMAEWVKKKKFVHKTKSRIELNQEQSLGPVSKKKKREIASVSSEESTREGIPPIWLVLIFGFIGFLFQFFRNKRS